MRKETQLILFVIVIVFFSNQVNAAHFVVGFVNDSYSGISANGYQVILWNPSIGISDNQTDTIGTTGNSGASSLYLIDCELLSNSCNIGNTLNIRVLNNGSDYISETASLVVTGAGFDTAPNIRLNSKPSVVLTSPVNFANVSSPANLFCTAEDLDSNLANITLYGNWSNSWHANQTLSTFGSSNQTNFSKSIPDGNYLWNCLAQDNLSISQFAPSNRTVRVDSTPPIISSIYANTTSGTCGTAETIRINCTTTDAFTGVQSVLIQSIMPNGTAFNTSTSLLSGNTYFADIILNQLGNWNFSCYSFDYANNSANLSLPNSIPVYNLSADLTLHSQDIIFSSQNPIEYQEITINATILNNGCSDANNFLVGFYNGDPDLPSSEQINNNRTITVLQRSNFTTNITWSAIIGTSNIFVKLDLDNSISESNETNNKANQTIQVTAWQTFYGNLTIDKILANSGTINLSFWLNQSIITGNVFITDTESNIDWQNLQSLGRNITNSSTNNDFSDVDTLLSMSSFQDSVSNSFTTNGNTPRSTQNFTVFQKIINNVPVINSTNTTNFLTGILWDISDDTNGQFDTSESEDLIFVTKVNSSSQGAYGIYDYEISIPARLREYETTDSSNIFIYFDLN